MQDILVIGGGLAGGAVATRLARAGRHVLLLERSAGPHDKVCGEFLSYEAQEDLRDLGIEPRALGAQPIGAVAVECGRHLADAELGFEALSLSRRVLDEALLEAAATAGTEVRRGARATSLERHADGWLVRVQSGPPLLARHVVMATGKHDLRGWKRPPGSQSDLVGLKMFWRWPGRQPDFDQVGLHVFPGGYAGFQSVEGGRANLCLVVREALFATLGHHWDALLGHVLRHCPSLADRLDGAEPCAPKPLAVARIPYGLVQRRSQGLWRLGDQAAVIPSFTGEGMSIALHSARLAARLLRQGGDPEEFQHRLASDLVWQVRRSTLLSRMLVAPSSQRVMGRLMTPPVLRWVVRGTRIPNSARSRLSASPS